MKIYTKTGDKGQTSLFGGKRVSKASVRVEAYGTVDELNSVIGVVVAEYQKFPPKADPPWAEKLKTELEKIQHDLFEIGSALATPSPKRNTLNAIPLKSRVVELEKLIDEMTKELPELKNFILPGGGVSGSLLHLARTVCRRAERRIVDLSQKEDVHEEILRYFNRLSDLLFTFGRFVNHKEKQKETIWSSYAKATGG